MTERRPVEAPSALAGLRLLLRTAARTDRFGLVVGLTAAVLSALLGAIFPLLYGNLVDAAVAGAGGAILGDAAAIGAAQALSSGARSISGMLSWNLWERMTVTIDEDLVGHTTRLGLVERVQDADYQDHLTLVRTNREHFQESMNALLWAVLLALQLVVTVAILVSVAPVLLVLPVFAVAPVLGAHWSERRVQRALRANVGDTRTADGLALVALDATVAGDLRVLRLADTVAERQRRAWRRAVSRQWRAELQGTAMSTAALALFTVGFAGALLYVTSRSLHGRASLGEVVVVLTAGQQLHSQIGSLLANAGALFRIVETMRNLEWLHRYVDLHEQQGSTPAPERLDRGIALRNVSFRYQGASRDALREVDLELPAGAVVALVGDNGAGKSTLVSLLCGLHRPTCGVIEVDGVPMDQLDAEGWHLASTAAFQEFVRYQLLAREAVGVGRVADVSDLGAVRGALLRAGVGELEAELPEGLDTPLGRAFLDGVDLSGGQWQKVALARSMMRPRPLLRILDEPTYSLDVDSERQVYDWFSTVAERESASGAITVIVSHRFSTVRRADLVVVMAEGRPVEVGSHDQLLNRDGEYARMYRTQASGYR